MDEKKFVQFKKKGYSIKKYVWNNLGKGKVSSIKIEYTQIGEKIIVSTDKPGLIIGKRRKNRFTYKSFKTKIQTWKPKYRDKWNKKCKSWRSTCCR